MFFESIKIVGQIKGLEAKEAFNQVTNNGENKLVLLHGIGFTMLHAIVKGSISAALTPTAEGFADSLVDFCSNTFLTDIIADTAVNTTLLLALHPLELIKMHYQYPINNATFSLPSNPMDWYTGLHVSLCGIVLYQQFRSIIYNTLNRTLLDEDANDVKKYILGFFATVLGTAGTLTYPLDTIRLRQAYETLQGSPVTAMEAYELSTESGLFSGLNISIGEGMLMAICGLLYKYLIEKK